MSAPDALDVRILADDLTGALDSAAAFAGQTGIEASWGRGAPGPRGAVDVATREGDEISAAERHAALSGWLGAGALRFKKVDSLLRGFVAAEIAACVAGAGYERIVVAPAFPFHGRVTRDGRQWLLAPDARPVGPDLRATLGATAELATKAVVCDAETDADLDRIVASGISAAGSTLWVGSGGLAAALARRFSVRARPAAPSPKPFLGLVGTDHPVTVAQAACFEASFPGGYLTLGDATSALSALVKRMAAGAPSLVGIAASGERRAMARRIREAFAALLDDCPPPGALFVTGGETLRAICDALEATRLRVEGEIEPGAPFSRMCDGRYSGVRTISKSGAFGDPQLIVRLSRGPASP